MTSTPNIVLITIDTLRPDHLGCYGYSSNTSPHLDRLAARGTVFKQAITSGSYTKPAFPAILSSTYGSMYGGPFADVGRQRPMLAGILRGYGYSTAGFTANPLLGANVGYDEGFDTFKEPVPPAEDRWLLRLKGAQRLMRSPAINGALMRLGMETRPHPVYVGAEEITEMACNWLDRQDSRPFFLWVHYMDAHWPYHLRDSLRTGQERARAWTDLQRMWVSRESYPGDAMLERVQHLYDSGIRFADEQIGRLLHRLDEHGITSETAVMLTSDHGEAFYEHGRWGHGALYDFHEEILRVPLIIGLPRETAARCFDRQVSLLDIAPTVLELVGIPADPRMEGQSLLPAVTSGVEVSDQAMVIDMVDLNWLCCGIRTEEYKYIYDERRPDHRELYALKDDPGEVQNLYGHLPDIERQFEAVLQRHLERVSSTGGRDDTSAWKADSDVVDRLRALGYIE